MEEDGWVSLQAHSAQRDVWVEPLWPDMPELGPYLLPDGQRVMDVIARGDVGDLPFPVWLQTWNSGTRLGDLLWTGGLAILPASDRFIAVLDSVEASGYRTYDIPLRRNPRGRDGGQDIPGYRGLAIVSDTDETTLRNRPSGRGFSFLARPHVVEALTGAGVDQFDREPYDMSKDR